MKRMGLSQRNPDKAMTKKRELQGDFNLTEEQLKRLDKAAEIYKAKQAAKAEAPIPQQPQPHTEERQHYMAKKTRWPQGDQYPTEEQNRRLDKAAEIYRAKQAAKVEATEKPQPKTPAQIASQENMGDGGMTDEQWKEFMEAGSFQKSLAMLDDLRRKRLSESNPNKPGSLVQSVLSSSRPVKLEGDVRESAYPTGEPTPPPTKSGRAARTALKVALAKFYGIELSDEELGFVLEQSCASIGKPTGDVN